MKFNLCKQTPRQSEEVRHGCRSAVAELCRSRKHDRLDPVDLSYSPVANFFQHLAHEGPPKARAIFVKADQVADALNLADEMIDGLVVRLSS